MADFKSALESLRDELFLDTADGKYLDVIGENLGVFRPQGGIDDETWRRVLRVVLMAPKMVPARLEALLAVLAGGMITIDHAGDALLAPPDLRVEVLLGPMAPVTTYPPAITVRLSGHGVPADAPPPAGPGRFDIDASGVQVGTRGSVSPAPTAPERVIVHATAGQADAQLAHTPVLPGSVELWVNPRTPAVQTPVLLSPAHYGVGPSGRITFDILPAPLTFFAPDPSTGAPAARPGLPPGALVLATYRIDTRTYAGLLSALRLKLPPVYQVQAPQRGLDRAWTDLEGLDRSMVAVPAPVRVGAEDAPRRFLRLASRITLRSWSLYDAGRALGPPDDQPTTPHPDRTHLGPRVFVDLTRRDDLTHARADLRQASYVHEDFVRPPPGETADLAVEEPSGEPWSPPPVPGAHPAPRRWLVHPWNASGNPALVGSTDPAFPGPYLYSYDERLWPCGREARPGDPSSWEPFAEEFATVLAANPQSGQSDAIVVRQDRHAMNPLSGAPLETAPGSGVLYRDLAIPRPYTPHPDRSDHPLVLFSEDFWLERLEILVDLVRAAGVFVTFERSPRVVPTGAPPWFCDPCHPTERYAP